MDDGMEVGRHERPGVPRFFPAGPGRVLPDGFGVVGVPASGFLDLGDVAGRGDEPAELGDGDFASAEVEGAGDRHFVLGLVGLPSPVGGESMRNLLADEDEPVALEGRLLIRATQNQKNCHNRSVFTEYTTANLPVCTISNTACGRA
jgi:hypothetical protein